MRALILLNPGDSSAARTEIDPDLSGQVGVITVRGQDRPFN